MLMMHGRDVGGRLCMYHSHSSLEINEPSMQ